MSPFPLFLAWAPLKRAWPPPVWALPSDIYKPWWDRSWASCFPSCIDLQSASLHRRRATIPSSSWWHSAELFSVCPCLSWTGEPRLGHIMSGMSSSVLIRRERSPALTWWQHYTSCRLDWCPSLVARAHFWFMVHLVSFRSPKANLFGTKLSPSMLVPKAWSSLYSRLRISISWTSWSSCQTIFPSYWSPSVWQCNSWMHKSLLHVLCNQKINPYSRSWMNMFKMFGSREHWTPGDTNNIRDKWVKSYIRQVKKKNFCKNFSRIYQDLN